ncbi:MAG: acyltransferase [Methylococcales bacterium]|jgi:galactoside O-acetyltransferase|nr:acyltransferase [Methylococcales bacterium]MBT6794170.1 acyltransferase [Methylococcales bacterium]
MKYFIDELYAWSSAIIRMVPGRIGRLLRKLIYQFVIDMRGKNISICEHVEISGGKNIVLGDHCYLVSGAILRACDNGKLTVGNYFAMNGNARIIADNHGQITIGHHVMIGPNVVLRASNHVTENVSRPIWEQGQTGGKITIGDDVWIGANVVVLPNVSIGSHVVVAAGAVVTKDVLDNVIVAGVPATILRHR